MPIVYALMEGQLVLYIGSTTQILKDRANQHRTKNNESASRYIPEHSKWVITILEDCTIERRLEREQYWIDILNPLYNMKDAIPKKTPLQRVKEYQARNKEKIKEKRRLRRIRKKVAAEDP